VESGNLQTAAQYLVDVLRLHQVLDNLVGNAIKYTDAGQITLGLELVEASEGRLLHFYVKDTGIGIPKEKQELIFERFRQAEEHGFREGAGLGLSISKGFVELMGGGIWVESEPGAGSCFHFTLPAAESGSKPVVRNLIKNLLVPDLRGKTLIIAEDDRDSYEFLQLLLEETGAIILRAENGNELLELIQARSPDLLMLDIRMPGKTGLQCLDIIRERGYNFRIIAQTAYALAEEQRQVISSGCHGYLSKPFTKQELFSCIHEVMAAGN
jgi:CheY-like chemotaxis protein